VCSVAGCKYFDVDSKSNAAGLQMDEVLVLSRTTNTVRAVAMQSGIEKYVHLLGGKAYFILDSENAWHV